MANFSRVQSRDTGFGTGALIPQVLGFTGANTAGNCIVVILFQAFFHTISDTQGNTYNLVLSGAGTYVFAATNINAGANIVTASDGTSMVIMEYASTNPSYALFSGAAASSGSVIGNGGFTTPTEAMCIYFAFAISQIVPFSAATGTILHDYAVNGGGLNPRYALAGEESLTSVPSLGSYSNTITPACGCVGCLFLYLTTSPPGPLAITCASPPAGVIASPYFHLFPASGGVAPYTWSIISGILPPGLSLDTATGNVTGTPTANGLYSFRIQVTDDVGTIAAVTCSITIAAGGAWVIQEVTAELIPVDRRIPGYGAYRYTVRCVNSAQAGTWLGFWSAFGSGGGGGGGGSTGGTSPPGPPSQPPGGGTVVVARNSVIVGAEQEINFIEGTGIAIGAADDPTNSKVDVTISATDGSVLLKAASYLITAADNGKLISFNSAGALTATLPATPPPMPWKIGIEDIGAGTLTVDRNGNVIDATAANLTIKTDQGVYLYSNGTQYYTERGLSIQGIGIDKNGVLVGTEPNLNLIEGTGITLTVTDNPGSSRVDATIAASAGLIAGGYLAVQKRFFSWVLQTNVPLVHNLSTTGVVVQVYDAAGNQVFPQTCTITSTNVATLTFGAAFTGTAVVVGGAAYIANATYQTNWTSQTSVTVTHNLNNSNVIVQVYDAGGVQAIPQNVQITNSNVVSLTFGAAFTGSVIVVSQPTPLPQSAIIAWIGQTTVTIFHNLQTTAVIVQVYDAGANEVEPQSITVVDDHTVTLTFAVAFTGSATVIG